VSRNRAVKSAKSFIALAIAWLHAPAFAAEIMPEFLRRQDAQVQALQERRPADTDVRFVVGNNLWQPGESHVAGANWLALVCDTTCSLQAAELRVRASASQSHNDDQPTPGQTLRFSRNNPGSGRVVAWLYRNQRHSWLSEREVTRYAFGPRQDSAGTMETTANGPGGARSDLVPMLYEGDGKDERARVYLQLRAFGLRQWLHGTLDDCEGAVAKPYLLWVGDLDGDGKADYIVDFLNSDGPVRLYLSSIAAGGRLVGLAGTFDGALRGGECDGGGWQVTR
jgi:hypothetical protein